MMNWNFNSFCKKKKMMMNWNFDKSRVHAIILLNQPLFSDASTRHEISSISDWIDGVWHLPQYRIGADGSANQLFHLDQLNRQDSNHDHNMSNRPRWRLDYIVGDMDSLRPDIGQYYMNHGTRLEPSPCQQTTDFQKCLNKLKDLALDGLHEDITTVWVLGGLGGRRFDQTLSTLHTLHLEQFRHLRLIVQNSPGCYTFLLRSDFQHIIQLHELMGEDSASEYVIYCGLVPLVGPSVITTEGLKWDVSQWECSMSTQVSTSNQVRDDAKSIKVQVSENPVVMTLTVSMGGNA